MARLPLMSGKAIVRVLGKVGYRVVRQRGSHIRLSCPRRKSVTIPDYKIIGRGLLRKILRDAEITMEEFVKLLL